MSQTKDSFDNAANNNADSIMRVENGDKIWRNAKGQIHRTDGPAIEWEDGSKAWWINGQLHRTDGPAIESADGGKSWWINDQRHRTDGPAIESADGSKSWWINDQRHRTDGPAIEGADGGKVWCLNGKVHRTDGPAIERADGHKFWFLNDKQLTEQEFNAHPLVQEAQRQKEAASQAEAKSRHFRALLKLAR